MRHRLGWTKSKTFEKPKVEDMDRTTTTVVRVSTLILNWPSPKTVYTQDAPLLR